ncbi:MAG: hypothetical protein WA208_18540 [Thermoanaerobaculia bacterium]
MPSAELDRLVSINLLSHEAPIRAEFEGLLEDAAATLTDSQNGTLSPESRFRLAYGAVHSIALAALRWHGYRPRNNRQVVFQALAHTLQVPAPVWRMLARSHEQRNRREYEGRGEIDERLLADVIAAGTDLLAQIRQLPLPEEPE